MANRALRRVSALCGFGLGLWFVSACGGRYDTKLYVDEDASTPSAGSGGYSPGHAGSSPGHAGSPGKAGSGAGGSCALACTDIGCAFSSHLEIQAGACCPVCVPNPGFACAAGQQSYAMDRQNMLLKYSYGCASSAECTVVAPSNRCEQGCQAAAVWYGEADSFTQNLSSSADMYCANCPPMPAEPCLAPHQAYCVNGQCQVNLGLR